MKRVYKILIITILMVIMLSSSLYAETEIEIEANASIMVELSTGKIIHENNAHEINYPASITKMMTAIVVIENCALDEVVTVSQDAIDSVPDGYVFAPLYDGEEMKVQDLLYAVLLPSASDAACALAEHVGKGSVDAFVELMNKKAGEIGCENTHFTNPFGVHDDDHYTTAYDLYLIAKYAMQNETFAKIVSTYKYTLPATNKYELEDRVMESTNYFIEPDGYYFNPYVKGVKTGTTVQAGNCIISYYSKDGYDAITVVLGADTKYTKFTESTKLFNFMMDNFVFKDVYKKGDIITSVDVNNSSNNDKLNLVIGDDIRVIHNKSIDPNSIKPSILLQYKITAPISAGQKVGTIIYEIDGVKYIAPLVAERKVNAKSNTLLIIFIVVVLLLVLLRIRAVCIRKKKEKTL